MIPSVTINWPAAIEFGAGKIATLSKYLSGEQRIFVLADPPVLQHNPSLFDQLKSQDRELFICTDVVPEPPFQALEDLLEPVRLFEPDAVVGIGGGSAMDLAKLVAVLYTGEQKAADVVGINNVSRRNVKLIAISTTSGTGSEVTPIAVLTDTAQKLKKGVVSPYLIPDVAIVDPELTVTLPPPVTAATGMDAMTHCIEAYTNRHAHPVIDNLALEGIRLIGAHLEKAVNTGTDLQARSAMALGSMYGGMCLGPVNTAAVHALAYPLGGEYKISHGVSNSALLPFVMNFNMPSCVEKYAQVAIAMGVSGSSSVESIAREGLIRIRNLSTRCGIPATLAQLKIPESGIPDMAEAAIKVTRLLENNPRVVTLDDARNIYFNAFHGILT